MTEDDQTKALSNDVERLMEENVALRKRRTILEKELIIEKTRHEANSAEISRLAALRADVSRCLCILEALKSKLLDEEED